MRSSKVSKVELGCDESQSRQEAVAKNLYAVPFLNSNYSLRQMESSHSLGQQMQSDNFNLMETRNSFKSSNHSESLLWSSTTVTHDEIHLQTQGQRIQYQSWEEKTCFLTCPGSRMSAGNIHFQWNNSISSYHRGPQTWQDPRSLNPSLNYRSCFDMFGVTHPHSQATELNCRNTSLQSESSSLLIQNSYTMGHHNSNLHYNPEIGISSFFPSNFYFYLYYSLLHQLHE